MDILLSFVFSVALMTFKLIGQMTAFSHSNYDLNALCGSTIQLGCDDDFTGILKSDSDPVGPCSVTVTIDRAFCSNKSQYAIYFNVKTLNLNELDSVVIRETAFSHPHTTMIVKQLPGGDHVSEYWPTSVAQLLSQYSEQPSLTIDFVKGLSSLRQQSSALTLDYNILIQEKPDFSYTRCHALHGFLLTDLICKTGDRINCPRSYHETSGLNPAVSASQGFMSGACSLDAHAVAGIIFVGIGGFCCVLVIISLAARFHRSERLYRPIVEVSETQISTASSSFPQLRLYHETYPGESENYGALSNGSLAGAQADAIPIPSKRYFR